MLEAAEVSDTDFEVDSETDDISRPFTQSPTGRRSEATVSSFDETYSPTLKYQEQCFDLLKFKEREKQMFQGPVDSSQVPDTTSKGFPMGSEDKVGFLGEKEVMYRLQRSSENRISSVPNSIDRMSMIDIAWWTPKQVARWMYAAGLERKIVEKFEKNDISGKIILMLKFEDLRELDILCFRQRIDSWNLIRMLRGKMISNRRRPSSLEEAASYAHAWYIRSSRDGFQRDKVRLSKRELWRRRISRSRNRKYRRISAQTELSSIVGTERSKENQSRQAGKESYLQHHEPSEWEEKCNRGHFENLKQMEYSRENSTGNRSTTDTADRQSRHVYDDESPVEDSADTTRRILNAKQTMVQNNTSAIESSSSNWLVELSSENDLLRSSSQCPFDPTFLKVNEIKNRIIAPLEHEDSLATFSVENPSHHDLHCTNQKIRGTPNSQQSLSKFPNPVDENCTRSGWMMKRRTKLLRYEWQSYHFSLIGTQLAMYKHEHSLDTLEHIDIDDYAIACSSYIRESKLIAAFKALSISHNKERSKDHKKGTDVYAFQLIPIVRKRSSFLRVDESHISLAALVPFIVPKSSRDRGSSAKNKTHYFAVNSRDERINWMRELMLAKALGHKNRGFEVNVNGNMV